MSDVQTARKFRAFAARDLRAVHAILSPAPIAEDIADEIVGFHLQQAVEKLLKAWLAARGHHFQRTHNLIRLFNALARIGESAETFRGLVELNPFAVELRYDLMDESDVPLDRRRLLNQTQSLFDCVNAIVEGTNLDSISS